MKKKLISVFVFSVFIMFAIWNVSTASNTTKKYDEKNFIPKWGIADNTVKYRDDKKGEIMPDLVKVPDYFYEGNAAVLSKDKYFNINEKINKDKLKLEKGEIKSITIMKYSEYLKADNISDIDTSISPDRMVWVVKLYYPEGIKADLYGNPTTNKDLFIKNAIDTTLYDGETGEFIRSSTESLI